jgi:uncharacterized membrane protein
MRMKWNRWYAIKSYLLSTLWVPPLIALALEQVTFRLFRALNIDFGWIPGFSLDHPGTSGAMDYVITVTITCVVFTFGSLLVAVQLAGGQLTPRIIATTLLRDRTIGWVVGLFVYTLGLAVAVKVRIDSVPTFLISLAAVLGLVCIVAILFLIDYISRLLRPVTIVWRVGEDGRKVIEDVYPIVIAEAEAPRRTRQELGRAQKTILHRGTSGIVIAVNLKALTAAARKADCIIEFVPRVGDFVSTGEPLFLLRGTVDTVDERGLRSQVAFGRERTIEQDSTFAFRVIVDIAIKALSAAINDPTTAVLAIDQLQRLLRAVGSRHLQDEDICDEAGQLRLIFRTPNWEDFVHLTFSEIRLYGAENFQIARRLRAMIESLLEGLPASRLPALRQELDLLDRRLENLHMFPEDLALARTPDPQGLGGATKG